MKNKSVDKSPPPVKSGEEKEITASGYSVYPARDDIYNKSHQEENIDPEDISKLKQDAIVEDKVMENEEVLPDLELDVPGSELDDDQENIGSEDEENNYYSIGGDNHNKLEEDNS